MNALFSGGPLSPPNPSVKLLLSWRKTTDGQQSAKETVSVLGFADIPDPIWSFSGKMVRESGEKFGQEAEKDGAVGRIGESHNEPGFAYEMRHHTAVSFFGLIGTARRVHCRLKVGASVLYDLGCIGGNARSSWMPFCKLKLRLPPGPLR